MSSPWRGSEALLADDPQLCLRAWWPWQGTAWMAASGRPAGRAGMRRRCRRLIRGIDVPRPFDVDRFTNGLQRQRGRRIMVVPIKTNSRSPCGLWIATDDTDYVFFEANTSPLHQRHIVLHEFGHMLFEHSGISPFSEPILRQAMPNLDPSALKRVLGRSTFTAGQEAEAEMFATLVGEKGAITDVGHEPMELPPDTAQMLTRLAAGLAEARSTGW